MHQREEEEEEKMVVKMQKREIPESVAMEILSKLPVKSLIRFRCVCKLWSSSFQASHFITKHYHSNLNNNNLNLLLRRCHGNSRTVDIIYFSALSTEEGRNFEAKENIHLPFFKDFLFDPVIYGPCNGLLCFSDGLSDYGFGSKLALWNPSTREFKVIPKSTIPRLPLVDSFYLSGLGFGYDSTTDDYKIIRFVNNNFVAKVDEDDPGSLTESIRQVELYSLRNDSWKEISAPAEIPRESPLFNNYINGFYYWKAIGNHENLILSFDIADEKFSTMPLPNRGENLGHLKLLDFNGLLGAIVYPWHGSEKSLDLWVMNQNNNGGSWTKQFRIEPVPGVERPLGFWKNGQIFLESSNHELVLFDPATIELKNLGLDSYRNKMQLITYFESLVPINGRSEHEEFIIRRSAGEASSTSSRH